MKNILLIFFLLFSEWLYIFMYQILQNHIYHLSLTWRKEIEYSVHKFYFDKNNIARLLSSSKMSLRNKILLSDILKNKILLILRTTTVVKPILLYRSHLWGSAASSNLQIIQREQNKPLKIYQQISVVQKRIPFTGLSGF